MNSDEIKECVEIIGEAIFRVVGNEKKKKDNTADKTTNKSGCELG